MTHSAFHTKALCKTEILFTYVTLICVTNKPSYKKATSRTTLGSNAPMTINLVYD